MLALAPAEVKRAITGNGAARPRPRCSAPCRRCSACRCCRVPRTSPTRSALAVTGMARAIRVGACGRAAPSRVSRRDRLAARARCGAGSRTASSSRRPASATRCSCRPIAQRALGDAIAGAGDEAERGGAGHPLPRHPEPAAPRPHRLHVRARQGVLREADHGEGRGPAGGRALARRAGGRDRRRHRAAGRGVPARACRGSGRRRPRTSSPSSRPRWPSSPWPAERRLRSSRRPAAPAARDDDGLREHGVRGAGQAARPPAERGRRSSSPTRSAAGPGSSTPEELFDEIYRGDAAAR